MNFETYSLEAYRPIIIDKGLDLLAGLAILCIGFWIAKRTINLIEKALTKANVDESLVPFLASILDWTLKIVVVLAAANQVGIETTSFIALLGTAGLAVGLALQGSLSNFAGGVIILLLKPFRVGDAITAQGFTGVVQKITTFSTRLKTGDNQVIVLPNGPLANAPIININCEPKRRVDFVFGIGYSDDIEKARIVIKDILENDARVLLDEGLTIAVSELADSSVNFTVRAWTKTSDYWGVKFDTTEKVKMSFDKEGISIPFPQRELRIIKEYD